MANESADIQKIETLEQANARIEQLEAKLDEAIEIILKRDDQLTLAERRICELERQLELREGIEDGE